MATPVPYNPAPQVAPEAPPIPFKSINTPPAAFGAATAAAVSNLGQVEQHVGDEVFSRAIAMQQMAQDADANNAAAQFATELARRTADYRSLQGKAAVDALPQFRDDINNLREQFRQRLSSPYAQRAYDADTRRNQSYTEFSIASHAADQLKHYTVSTAGARIDAARNMTLVNPKDEEVFQEGLRTSEKQIRDTAPALGLSGDALNEKVSETKSGLWRDRIIEVAKNEPWAATEILKKAMAGNSLSPDDLSKAQAAVRKSQLDIGSRNIAHSAMTGEAFGKMIVSPDMARIGIAGNEADGRGYSTVGITVPANSFHPAGQAIGRYAIMSYNLAPWLKEAGMAPMTQEQFLGDSKAQDRLFDFKFGQYMKQTGSFDGAADLWFGKGASDGYHTHAWYLDKAHATMASVASRADLDKIVRDESRRLASDNPDLPDAASSRVQTIKSRRLQIDRDQEFQDLNTVQGALFATNKDGKVPGSVEELTHDPDVKAAWDRLKNDKQLQIYRVIEHNAREGDYGYTEQNQQQFYKTYGALTNPQLSADERDEALKTDIMSLPLPASQRMTLLKAQQNLFKKSTADPNMTRAMSDVQDMTAGVLDKKGNPDDYNLFWGSFRFAIQDRMVDEKRPLNRDEVRSIAQGLLMKQSSFSLNPFSGFKSSTPAYRMPVPTAARTAIESEFRKQGIEPNDMLVSEAWNTQQLKMFDKRSSQPSSSNWKPVE